MYLFHSGTINEIECNTYTMSFPNIDDVQRNFVFGNKKHDFEHKNVIYFPIYLVVDDEVKDRIGVFENYLDELHLLTKKSSIR